jgi:hypothetical protein
MKLNPKDINSLNFPTVLINAKYTQKKDGKRLHEKPMFSIFNDISNGVTLNHEIFFQIE